MQPKQFQNTARLTYNESIFLATETRKEQRRKGMKRKGRFSHKQESEDPEIQAELRKGNIVTIIQDR